MLKIVMVCCRSFEEPMHSIQDQQGPQLMLQLSRKVLRGTEQVHQDMCLTIQAIAAQLCPAAVQQVQ